MKRIVSAENYLSEQLLQKPVAKTFAVGEVLVNLPWFAENWLDIEMSPFLPRGSMSPLPGRLPALRGRVNRQKLIPVQTPG